MTGLPTRSAGVVGKIFGGLFAFAFLGIIGSCVITIGIWPGQIKLLAPLFCTDAQPDAFVVADTYSPQPGETVTNFSLYCMGPRGDSTDHGFMIPFLLISVLNGIVLFALLVIVSRPVAKSVRSKIPDFTVTDSPGYTIDTASTIDDDTVDTIGASIEPQRPDGDRPRRSPAPPGSTPGPFVD